MFGFIQRKLEEKILGDIHLELISSYGLVNMFYRSIDCHLGGQHTHKILGIRLRQELRVFVHFCDSVGLVAIQNNSQKYPWVEANWLTPDTKKSAASMVMFLAKVEDKFG